MTNPADPAQTRAVPFRFSDVLIDHVQHPRNMDDVPVHNGFAINDGYCGDSMSMWVNVEGGVVTGAAFQTDGCGPSVACGSMATEMAKNKPLDEARELTPEKIERALGGLPEDHRHCASLAAGTLQLALADYLQPE